MWKEKMLLLLRLLSSSEVICVICRNAEGCWRAMGDIVKSLKFLEFPECTKQALKFLATSLSSTSAGDGKYISDVCQDYILFRRSSHRVGWDKSNEHPGEIGPALSLITN